MAASTLTIRLNNNLKDEASRIIEQPNEESLAALRETKEMIADGSGESYDNGHDLIQAALA